MLYQGVAVHSRNHDKCMSAVWHNCTNAAVIDACSAHIEWQCEVHTKRYDTYLPGDGRQCVGGEEASKARDSALPHCWWQPRKKELYHRPAQSVILV